MTKTAPYPIVGGGMTAAAAIEGIRERDADGAIMLVGAETHPPYKRQDADLRREFLAEMR